MPQHALMSLADRLRALAAQMLPGFAEGVPESQAPKREVMAVDAWRQRLLWSTRVTRALGIRGQDRLTAVGETVQLPFISDPMRRLRAERVRVMIGEEVALDTQLASVPEIIHFCPRRAGLFEI